LSSFAVPTDNTEELNCTSVEELTPADELVSAEELTPKEGLTPTEELAPAAELTPKEGFTPAEELTPTEGFTSAEELTPTEGFTSAGELTSMSVEGLVLVLLEDIEVDSMSSVAMAGSVVIVLVSVGSGTKDTLTRGE
jgi:hypothetical protein